MFLIAATVVAAVLIGIFSARGRNTTLVENAGGTVVSPMQSGVSEAGGFFGRLWSGFGSVKKLKQENEQLKNKNNELEKQIRDMEGMEKENDRLRAMLKLKEKQTKIDMVAASISAKDPSNWYSTFTINRGSKDGIAQNQAVVNANRELVGQILRVGENWAEVITVIDSQSSVGALIKRSKVTGIIEGDGTLRYDGECRLGYIARDADIQTGDFVETSGLGGIFPKGLVIGTVKEIYDENSTMSKAAVVEPLADVASLSDVFVITAYRDEDLSEDEQSDEEGSDDNDDDNSDDDGDGGNDDNDDDDSSSRSRRDDNDDEDER